MASAALGLGVAGAGVLVFLFLWFLGKASLHPGRETLLKVGAVFLGGGLLAYGAMVSYAAVLGGGPPPPPGGGGVQPEWTWRVSSTEADSNHDAAAEFPDAPFTACASASPAGTIGVWDTDAFWDGATSTATVEIDVDDDVAATVAGYSAPDCVAALDIFLQVSNFVDNNDDSIMDDVPYFGRWRTISSVTQLGSANNGSQTSSTNIFESTNAAGWHFGFGDEVDAPAWAHAAADHGYIGACVPGTPGYSTAAPASSCYSRWVPLGVYDDGDPDVVSIWSVLRNNGPFGYLAVKGMQVKATIDIGVPGSFFTVEFVYILDTIA